MYQYIALGTVILIFIVWALFRLFVVLHRTPITIQTIDPISTNTSSSIAITEDEYPKKQVNYKYSSHKKSQKSHLTRDLNTMNGNISDESVKSRNSFGFVPSIRSVAPLSNRGTRGTQNFLMLLDSLDVIDDEDAKKSKPRYVSTAASSSCVEANSSDETASQTLIGKELDVGKDIGPIQLNYIKIQDV